MASDNLVVYFSIAQIATTLTVFTIASIFESFGKTTAKLCPRLRTFQLATTGLIITINITHVGLLAYPSAIIDSNADATVACALFLLLTWVILLLPLIDRTGDAAYPHYAAWSSLLVFETITTSIILVNQHSDLSVKTQVDYGFIIARLVAQIILLSGSTLVKYRFATGEACTEEETQPLLDVESSKPTGADSDKKNGEDAEDEDEDDKEEDEWKDDMEALKKRSWSQYVASFKIFLPHLRPRTKSQYLCLVVMLACTGIDRVLNVLTPLSLGWVVNSFEDAQSLPWSALGKYLGLYFVNSSAGISVIQSLASVRMSMGMRKSLDTFVYNHVMNLDAKFHDGKKTAKLGRITDRGNAVIDLFQDFFFELLPTLSDLVISLAVLQWMFGAYVSFIAAITAVLFTWSNTHLIKKRTIMRRKYVDAWCAYYDHMFETQYNWATVSHFGRIEHEKGIFKGKNGKKVTEELKITTYTSLTRCTRQLIMTTGFIFAILLAANQIIHGHRTIGDFVMLVSYWSRAMGPVRSIITTITTVSERLVDAEKMLLLLEKKPDVQDPVDAPEFEFKGGNVDFEDVAFSYDGERTVSEGITFHADAGQTIALVGETGGGKSTLLKLLFRFYDPTKGRILVDGQDLREVRMESFRQCVGIVPQDPAMFNRSVLENVRYPDNTASEEDVIEACKGACLHDKIMTFAKQYQEKVGEHGTKLSGGECQRLAIARAILKRPKMLLLDEATSSVDSVTENKIQSCLKELCKGRTTFVIAHRLSTILHADQIMVIKGGKLLEMGPHKKLIKQKGAYRELWDAQLNLQAQSPDDIGEKSDEKVGEASAEKKGKKPSFFYNDMDGKQINEEMLLAFSDDAESKNGEDDGIKDQLTVEATGSGHDYRSGDVTEVETHDSDVESSDQSLRKDSK